MNYKIVVTNKDSSDVVLEKDFDCGYLFLGESDGCATMRVSEGCDFDIMLNTALAMMKYAYEEYDLVETFARFLFESKYMEEKNDN